VLNSARTMSRGPVRNEAGPECVGYTSTAGYRVIPVNPREDGDPRRDGTQLLAYGDGGSRERLPRQGCTAGVSRVEA